MNKDIVTVSIIIKALNEEEHIANTIESAIRATRNIKSEIILADSYSTDKTVEIASRYPIKIVRLNNPQERCCGIGAQLGYQFSTGKYICIIDGDMALRDEFVIDAISYLDKHANTAGVGGLIIEKNLQSLEYQARLQRDPEDLQPGEVDRLNGGGIYRRDAIESIDYLTNKNLHSCEEYELGVRLRHAGWQLIRISTHAISHFGHKTGAYRLLFRRWRSKYTYGTGELLRSAIGKPYFLMVLKEIKELYLYIVVIAWWILLFILILFGSHIDHSNKLAIFLIALPLIVIVLKKRSFSMGLYSFTAWNIIALSLLSGFSRSQSNPASKIDAEIVKDNHSNLNSSSND